MKKEINLESLKEPENKKVLKQKRAQRKIINIIKAASTREIQLSVRLNEEEAQNMSLHAIKYGEGIGPFLRRILRKEGYFDPPKDGNIKLSEKLKKLFDEYIREENYISSEDSKK